MFYRKKGLPEENEIVLCTVKKILPHGVFVSLDEYETGEGLIHISEISPGRVRNIRDFVKEDKKIVCKILRIHDKNHMDLSLRRVNQAQRINKNKEYKQEQKSEKIMEIIGKQINSTLEEMYNKVGYNLINEYGSLSEGFREISENQELINKLNLDKNLKDLLLKLINEKIKQKEIIISTTITLISTESNGITIIKDILKKIQAKVQTEITYLGAPRYRMVITAKDYKTAEKQLSDIEVIGAKEIKNKGIFKIERNDKRNP